MDMHKSEGTQWITGVASYVWDTGARAPSFNFSSHFRAAQTDIGLFWSLSRLPRKNIGLQAYSFVTVYCVNFVVFLCVTLKTFALSFVPLLAPNPGNTTAMDNNRNYISYKRREGFTIHKTG